MNTISTPTVTSIATVQAPIANVWDFHTNPVHILNWMNLNAEYNLTLVEYSFINKGLYNYTFSPIHNTPVLGFYFSGNFSNLVLNESITYNFVGGFSLNVTFNVLGENVEMIYSLEYKTTAPSESITNFFNNLLNNFSTYVSRKN